jgi:hypothetical protein
VFAPAARMACQGGRWRRSSNHAAACQPRDCGPQRRKGSGTVLAKTLMPIGEVQASCGWLIPTAQALHGSRGCELRRISEQRRSAARGHPMMKRTLSVLGVSAVLAMPLLASRQVTPSTPGTSSGQGSGGHKSGTRMQQQERQGQERLDATIDQRAVHLMTNYR